MSSFTINDDVTLTSSASIDNIRISGNTIYSTNTDGNIVLLPNGNGNVGIGTASPQTNLHVEGNFLVNAYESNNEGKGIFFRKDHGYGSSYPLNISITTKDWVGSGSIPGGLLISGVLGVGIHTGSNTYKANNVHLLVTSTGNVGIGTSSPAAKLDVGGSNNNGKSLQLRSGDGSISNTDSAQIILSYNNASYDNGGYGHSIRTRHNGSAASGNAIDFWLWNHGVDTTSTLGSLRVMTLDGNGNVGIGTSSPRTRFQVNSPADLFYSSNTSGQSVEIYGSASETPPGYSVVGSTATVMINSTDAYAQNVGASISLGGRSYPHGGGAQPHTVYARISGVQQPYTDAYYGNFVVETLYQNTGGLREALRIDGNGNVGVGTSSPSHKLHVDGAIYLTSNPSNPGNSTSASFWNQSGVGPTISGLSFTVQTNGTSERLRINSSGNVGIGTTTPTAKLDVSGLIKTDHLSLGIKQYPNVGGQWLTINLNTYNGNAGPNAPEPEGGIMFSNIDGNNIFKWGYYMGVVKPSVSDQSDSQRLDIGRTNDVESQISGGTAGTFIPSVTVFNDKVGIGTNSPTEKLEIAGTLKHQGLTLNEGTSPNVDEVKTFNLTVSFNTTTWTDVGIYREDLASGSYIIQLFVNSTSGVVANRETFYTGFMSWFGTNNIYGDPPTYNEILLHHAGRLQWNGSVFYLRTYRDGTAGTLRLQIKNATRAASVSMTFKFRRMI